MSGEPEKTGSATAEAEARAAELREEKAITDERRAEEDEAKAQDAVAAAEKEESKKERKRREAEERTQAAAAESERARDRAGEVAAKPDPVGSPVSGAAVSSPGLGPDPKAAAAAGAGSHARPAPDGAWPGARAEGPEKPELYLAAAFAGAFLFARILKRIAE